MKKLRYCFHIRDGNTRGGPPSLYPFLFCLILYRSHSFILSLHGSLMILFLFLRSLAIYILAKIITCHKYHKYNYFYMLWIILIDVTSAIIYMTPSWKLFSQKKIQTKNWPDNEIIALLHLCHPRVSKICDIIILVLQWTTRSSNFQLLQTQKHGLWWNIPW